MSNDDDVPKGYKRIFVRSVFNKKLNKRVYPKNARFFTFLVKDD